MTNLSEFKAALAPGIPQRLKDGGGDGTFDDMERIERLEKAFEKLDGRVDKLAEQVSDLRVQSATLVERVSHLPSKEFIYKGIAGLVAVMGALAVLAPKLQQLFGIIPR